MIAFTGAAFSMKLSIFSAKSNTTAMVSMSRRQKKNVPRNFRIMYRSIIFVFIEPITVPTALLSFVLSIF